jgi:hypothetical protein
MNLWVEVLYPILALLLQVEILLDNFYEAILNKIHRFRIVLKYMESALEIGIKKSLNSTGLRMGAFSQSAQFPSKRCLRCCERWKKIALSSSRSKREKITKQITC